MCLKRRLLFWGAVAMMSGGLFACSAGSQAKRLPAYEPARFEVEDLLTHLNEPMELSFLPDGNILFIERRGLLKLYHPSTAQVKVAGELPVHYINENGLLGLAVDPQFEQNHWIYLFFTDPVRKTYQRISRFTFENDQLQKESEKLLLDFYIDVEHCCHFGGNLAFGPGGLLYISTGDNVGGTDYGPIDERPGHALQDAQRSSANSMDLRGKILRIQPLPDGTYRIPEGNLFPPGDSLARPEIYIMGVRNPLKIFVDPHSGWLFWGDVGPNPGVRDPRRGPSAHEEINLAKTAGNYGWPYLIADNKPYRDYDYASGKMGDFFDPQHLLNDSPNNRGHRQLPPARKALIWYPNTPSDSFPLVGQGGGTLCAGPVYHYDPRLISAVKFPSHFDGKLFIYEWMRSWILAVELDEAGNYVGMEAFLPPETFKKPIDMTFGPDGALYVLDYGSNWYAHNADARLSRVVYRHGNRPPKARIQADKLVGALPLEVRLSAAGSTDPDGDELQFRWQGAGSLQHGKEAVYTFEKSGTYPIRLWVTDARGATDSTAVEVLAGNEAPQLQIAIAGNRSFYRPGQAVNYEVSVHDAEDGSTAGGGIEPESVRVELIPLSHLLQPAAVRHAPPSASASLAYLNGKLLMQQSDCFACHAYSQASVGPSLEQISARYGEPQLEYLSNKVLQGGSGVWGPQMMTAHPQHSREEARQMVQYILSLDKKATLVENLPLKGSFTPRSLPYGLYVLQASYTDRGAAGMPSLQAHQRLILRPHTIPAGQYDYTRRVTPKAYNEAGDLYAEVALNGAYVGLAGVDFSGMTALRIRLRSNAGFVRADVHRHAPDGPLMGSKRVDLPPTEDPWKPLGEADWFWMELPLKPLQEVDDLYVCFYSDKSEANAIYFDICQLHTLEFVFSEM